MISILEPFLLGVFAVGITVDLDAIEAVQG